MDDNAATGDAATGDSTDDSTSGASASTSDSSSDSTGTKDSEFHPITSREEADRFAKGIRRDVQTKLADKYKGFDDLKKKAEEFDKLTESQKTEVQKATEARTTAEKERDDARMEVLRFKVAAEKNLTPKQAARLRGTTEEELAADADELLEEFTSDDGKGKGPKRQPKENLRGGSDPTEETGETDPKKLADQVPRGW